MKIEWILDEPVDSALLSQMQIAADATLLAEGITMPCYISLRICDDQAIRELNRTQRNIDRSTDVLSFPATGWPSGMTAGRCPELLRRAYDPEEEACMLGDVVISITHLKEQAMEYNHSEAREGAYLLVHSICHLMGYDHIKEDEKVVMREQEEKILSSVGLSRDREERVKDDVLLHLAREAMKRSYSPYSHYPVGAAIHSTDGRIFQGCNIENASFGATICAERTAIVKAVSEGAREFDVIAIATEDTPGWPCGICRQFLSEFAPDIRVIVTWGDGAFTEESALSGLLPHQFDLKGGERKNI